MFKSPRNKMMSSPKSKKVRGDKQTLKNSPKRLHRYFFPHERRSVVAESQEEALKKIKS